MITAPVKNLQRIIVVKNEPNFNELISISLGFVGFNVRAPANGGKVGVVSKLGAGTPFTLFFPTEKA